MQWAQFKGKGGDGKGDGGAEETKGGEDPTASTYVFGKGAGEEGKDWYGEEESAKAAEALTDEPCLWDADMHYELQVELALTIKRLVEQFAGACLSIQHSRSFDAVCTIVPGVACAILDAILRRLATDQPSEFTAILMGCTVEGRHLGMPGFGVSVGTFAEQTETMELHSVELAVARTAVIDYFQSPNQNRLDKIFDWENEFIMKPTRQLIKFIRHVARSAALASGSPHYLLLDQRPESSQVGECGPEIKIRMEHRYGP